LTMSEVDVPLFEDALRQAGSKLSKVMGSACTIGVHITLDEGLMAAIKAVDDSAFRAELRYEAADLMDRVNRRGFVAIVAHCAGKLLGFVYGYDDPEVEGGFYGDTLASSVEGKGVGSTMFTLMLLYCYDNGYRFLSLQTEDVDEKGRHLRRFYEALGAEYLYTDPRSGVHMRMRLDPRRLNEDYRRFILEERSRMDSTASSNPPLS
jgi:GNAT superfamily N-acetyltransferase